MASSNGKAPTQEAKKLLDDLRTLETRDFVIEGEANRWQKARHRRRRAEWAAWLQIYKTEHPCTDCDQHFPYYVMQFDHPGRWGEEKDSAGRSVNVWRLIQRNTSAKRIMEEILACELVCANCHAARSHFQRIEAESG